MIVGMRQQARAIWHSGGVSRHFTFDYEERAQLRDGTPVVLRLLRPEDKELLRIGFERLSPESRYARFFSPKQTLSDDELHYLCDIDQESHFAIGAVLEGDATRGLGIARFITVATGTAEAAIAVADDMQGQGLGRLLFLRLCAAAYERGITKFKCEVLGSNTGMQHLLDRIAPDRVVEVSEGVISFELVVPQVAPTDTTVGPAREGPMYRLFRGVAENTLDWTEMIRKLWGGGSG